MSRATLDTARLRMASCTGLSPSAAVRSGTFHSPSFLPRRGPNPAAAWTEAVWAAPRSLATPGGITFCFLFLRVLRCFSSPRLPAAKRRDSPSGCRVFPFGDPRIRGHLHLPAAYRSLSRPSSHVRAKASSVRPFLLSLAPAGPKGTAEGYTSAVLSYVSCLVFLTTCSVCQRSPGYACMRPDVENIGFEPMTPCLQSRCSSQLS